MDDKDWLELLGPFDRYNERHTLALFSMFGIPQTLLDVGSGTGAMVNIARRLGVEAYGVDQIERDEDWLFTHDLTEPFSLTAAGGPSVVDMVFCFEVAEHLPPEFDTMIADTVANHLNNGGLLFFTSALPGQGGDDHVGERPPAHWRDLLHVRGVTFKKDLTYMLALQWTNIQSPLMWLPANLMVFKK